MSGIQPHSMPVREGPWVIFATTAFPEQAVRDEFAVNGIRFKQLEGHWEGQEETSWIVHHEDFTKVEYLAEGETAVLFLLDAEPGHCGARKAWQMNIHSGLKHFLGYFQEVGQAYAEKQQGYTFDRNQWRWWAICDKPPEPAVPVRVTISRMDRLTPEEMQDLIC